MELKLVKVARARGVSWTRLRRLLGVSKQTASTVLLRHGQILQIWKSGTSAPQVALTSVRQAVSIERTLLVMDWISNVWSAG